MRFEDVEKRLSSKIPGYQTRPSQQKLAAAIEEGLNSRKGLLAQGPVGVGKSLAGMVPAISYALDKGGRVIVATSTIALMEQYVNNDVPLLEQESGMKFTWGMVKGKGRYVCQINLNDAEATAKIPTIKALRAELTDDHSGDFEHVTTPITDMDRMLLSTSADDCPGASDCIFGTTCYAEKAKTKALQSQVVITNTAMLMADLELRKGTGGGINVLGDYDAVIVDEGHLLENSASNSLGIQITQRGMESLVTRVHSFLRTEGAPGADKVTVAARDALEQISSIVLDEQDTDEINKAWFINHADGFLSLIDALGQMVAQIKITSPADEKSATRRKILGKQCANMMERIPEIIMSEDYELVRWIETKIVGVRDKKHTVWTLKTAPVDVSDFLRSWLFERVPTIVMSGTLATKDSSGQDDFEYIRRSIGAQNIPAQAVDSPFDYDANQLVWVPPASAPTPKEYHNWIGWSQGIMLELIDAAPDAGGLILFTSRKDMEAAYENLRERFEDRGREAYMQGLDYSNKELAERFKSDVSSVLFGLASFGTGFDAKGDTCKTVIISKLPFDVPTDPIFKAKSLKLENEGLNPFGKLSLPRMAMTLEQFSGRALRTVTDRAVVAILDQRLTTTSWGRQALSTVPGRKTTSLREVREFHEALAQ